MEQHTHTIDATGQSLGRLASNIAVILRGKHKPSFEPHIDGGDRVIVKNIQAVSITGRKLEQKVYHRHTGFPGGIKTTQLKHLQVTDPAQVLRRTVRLMLPDVKFRSRMLQRLIIE